MLTLKSSLFNEGVDTQVPFPDWLKPTLEKYSAIEDLRFAGKVPKEIPNNMTASHSLFRLIRYAPDYKARPPNDLIKFLSASMTMAVDRSATQPEATDVGGEVAKAIASSYKYLALADAARDFGRECQGTLSTLRKASKSYRDIVKVSGLESLMKEFKDEITESGKSHKFLGYDGYMIEDLYVFHKKGESFIISTVHLQRFILSMNAFFNVQMGIFLDMGFEESEKITSKMIELSCKIAEEDSDSVPMVWKGVRQYLIASLDQSHIAFEKPEDELLKTFNEVRIKWTPLVIEKMRDHTNDKCVMINLANFYKALPHPDSDIYKIFEDLIDLQKPNRADKKTVERFKAAYRRDIFNSIRSKGMYVVLRSASGSANPLVVRSKSSGSKHEQILNATTSDWADARIELCSDLPKLADMEVRVSAKSSAKTFEYTVKDLEDSAVRSRKIDEEGLDPSNLSGPFSSPSSVSDIRSEILGETRLSYELGKKRVEELYKQHRLFERQSGYSSPEDIPAEKISQFVLANEKARHLVATEPKFGEKHKKYTRMFYMAEQEVKTVLQRVERLVKLITRKQVGVSIVKSHKERTRDLNRMCRTMATSIDPESGSEIPGHTSLYMSFDMEKFSKKFPMEILRAAGEVLFEATGEDILTRLDIIFRSAVVVHNTRNVFEYMAGVKGGFEGFLNFLWSSIHATVMRLSMETQGLKGDLLTFSDDGILRILTPNRATRGDIRRIVNKIQEFYQKCGLQFNLAKNLVSSDVWEYLGDVGYKGCLIPMWMKELSSVATTSNQRGVNTIRSRLDALEGQVDACSAAGMSTMTGFVLKMTHWFRIIARLDKHIPSSALVLLSILPSSLSGFSMRYPLEMTVRSGLPNESNLFDNLQTAIAMFPEQSTNLIGALVGRLTEIKDPLMCLLSGNFVRCDVPSSTGGGIMNYVIEKISDRYGIRMRKNPYSSPQKHEMTDFLSQTRSIDQATMSRLLMSLPEWSEYNDSISFVKSNAVLPLLGKSLLRKLQARDTNNGRKCIDFVIRAMSTRSDLSPSKALTQLYEESTRVCLKSLDVQRFPFGHKSSLNISATESDISCVSDRLFPTHASEYLRLPRSERLLRSANTLDWSQEKKATAGSKALRSMLSAAVSFVTKNPTSASFVKLLFANRGYAYPSAVINDAIGSYRRKATHNYDSELVGDSMIMSSVRAYYTPEGFEKIRNIKRLDRSLFVHVAKAMSSIRVWMRMISSSGAIRTQKEYHYSISAAAPTMASPEMHSTAVADLQLGVFLPHLPGDILDELRQSIRDEIQMLSIADDIDMAASGDMDVSQDDEAWIKNIAIDRASSWISCALRGTRDSIPRTDPLPLSPIDTTYCLSAACMKSTMKNLTNTEKASLKAMAAADMYPLTNPLVQAVLRKCQETSTVLQETIVGGDLKERFGREFTSPDYLIEVLKIEAPKLLLFTTARKFVTRDTNSLSTVVSRGDARLMRDVFATVISDLYDAGRSAGWTFRNTEQSMIHDMKIDLTTAARDFTRPSDHRSRMHPFNRKTVQIQLYKLYILLDYHILKISSSAGGVRRDRLTEHEIVRMRQKFVGFSMHLGPDHEEMMSSALPESLRSRLLIYVNMARVEYEKFDMARKNHMPPPKCDLWFIRGGTFESSSLRLPGLLHELYQRVIAATINNTQVIDQEAEAIALKCMKPITTPSPTLLGSEIIVPPGKLFRGFLNKGRFDESFVYQCGEILHSSLRLLRSRCPGLRVIGKVGTPSDTLGSAVDRILPHVKPNTEDLADFRLVVDRKFHYESEFERVISPVFQFYQSPKEALADYLNLRTTPLNSLTIFQESTSRKYIVAGFVAGHAGMFDVADPKADSVEHSIVLPHTIAKLEMEEAASLIEQDLQSLRSSYSSRSIVAPRHSLTVLDIMPSLVPTATYLVPRSFATSAAFEYITSRTSRDELGTGALFMLYLLSCPDMSDDDAVRTPTDILNEFKEFYDFIKHNVIAGRKARDFKIELLRTLNEVICWAHKFELSMCGDVDLDSVNTMKSLLSMTKTITLNVIEPINVALQPRDPDEVRMIYGFNWLRGDMGQSEMLDEMRHILDNLYVRSESDIVFN